jgi:integrase
MASIQKTASGRYKAYVTVNYKVKTKTFDSKGEANAWAAKLESALKAGETLTPDIPYKAMLEKYREEVSPKKKRGGGKEILRINAFIRENPDLCAIKIKDLSRKHFADYRDKRLKTVKGSTVTREFNLLSNVFRVAIDEWEWLKENPMTKVRRPPATPGRDRRISPDEIDAICQSAVYSLDKTPENILQRVAAAFTFAIETAMRAQEICNLKQTNLSGRSASLQDSKTATGVRQVPLSKRALEILEQMKRVDLPGDSVFHLSTSQLDSNFRKLTTRLMIEDIHFHDTRHEAMTRLARKVPVLDLARITGIKDLKILMVYYNATAEDIAPLLD